MDKVKMKRTILLTCMACITSATLASLKSEVRSVNCKLSGKANNRKKKNELSKNATSQWRHRCRKVGQKKKDDEIKKSYMQRPNQYNPTLALDGMAKSNSKGRGRGWDGRLNIDTISSRTIAATCNLRSPS